MTERAVKDLSKRNMERMMPEERQRDSDGEIMRHRVQPGEC